MVNNKKREIIFLFEICLYFIYIASSFTKEECDKTKCPGPSQYYDDLNCKPIYKNSGDCCAVEYDCSYLKERSRNKCYVNNHVYEIGDKLKDEDANPCDIGCSCMEGQDKTALFNCAIVDCFSGPVKPGCFRMNSPNECCPGEEKCPENPEDRAKCIVDGKTYLEGEYFVAKGEPKKSCTCQPGYEGKNVEPFCYLPKRPYCSPEFRNANDIRENCAPVYYILQSLQTSCSVFYRCQNSNDTLISNAGEPTGNKSATCTFGNIKMRIGDELNQATDYNSVCVKCICDVPPIPTCQRLLDTECDVTAHPPFHHD